LKRTVAILIVLLTGLFTLAPIASSQEKADPKVSAEQLNDDAIELMRQDIRSQRKQLVAANMTLTDEEATKFWPMFEKYVAERKQIDDLRFGLIKEYAQSYQAMTDGQAKSFITRWLTADKTMTEMRLKWIPQFEKVISPKKTAAFFQIERRTGMMIDLQLSSQVPLVKH
jgi:hypothetical protein